MIVSESNTGARGIAFGSRSLRLWENYVREGSALASVRAHDLENLRDSRSALAPVRSGAAGRVARTPFGLLPALSLGIPFVEARRCRWAGGKPGNLLRGGAAVDSTRCCTLVAGAITRTQPNSRSSPLARPHPSPLPEGEGGRGNKQCLPAEHHAYSPTLGCPPAQRHARASVKGVPSGSARSSPKGVRATRPAAPERTGASAERLSHADFPDRERGPKRARER